MAKGSIVSTSKHEYRMTIGKIDSNKAFCQYFIGNNLHEEWHDLKDLTIV